MENPIRVNRLLELQKEVEEEKKSKKIYEHPGKSHFTRLFGGGVYDVERNETSFAANSDIKFRGSDEQRRIESGGVYTIEQSEIVYSL